MKTGNLIMLIAYFSCGLALNAAGPDEKNVSLASVINLMEVSNKNIHINCWTNEEFASRIGTTESELDDHIRDLFQDALEETKKSVREDATYFLQLNQYDLSAAGYPYNNFQHTVEYIIYDKDMKEVYTGNHRFVTFSNVSKEELTKQFKKLSRKILSVINKNK
ncbi:MAG: hypothetical protein LBF17_05905 [Mediterranea sp.]|jgi:hypothetical protein|nr:hypothetical protein [Mediterranea sp.]